jgi:hypothetical protein
MTRQQEAAVDELLGMTEGPAHVFEGENDVLLLHDGDTRIVSIDAAGNLSSGYVVPSADRLLDPGWDTGWTP